VHPHRKTAWWAPRATRRDARHCAHAGAETVACCCWQHHDAHGHGDYIQRWTPRHQRARSAHTTGRPWQRCIRARAGARGPTRAATHNMRTRNMRSHKRTNAWRARRRYTRAPSPVVGMYTDNGDHVRYSDNNCCSPRPTHPTNTTHSEEQTPSPRRAYGDMCVGQRKVTRQNKIQPARKAGGTPKRQRLPHPHTYRRHQHTANPPNPKNQPWTPHKAHGGTRERRHPQRRTPR